MKLEVDLFDKAGLIKTREQLRRALALVDYALSEKDGSKSKSTPADSLEGESAVLEVIKSLPEVFTSAQVYAGNVNRSTAKLVLEKAVEGGSLRLKEKGIGRRPAKYEKVQEPK